MIYSTLSCNLDAHLLLAAVPLFAEQKVDAIERSFDALYKWKQIPSWFTDLLSVYSENNRLIGHGVFFSIFSGKWSENQDAWLQDLKKVTQEYKFQHITEHFGFMTGSDFHTGAPLGVPYTSSTLAIGKDRLQRIIDACNCPVGLENLAFSYSIDEVKKHGQFLSALIQPVNGFIILDIHNLYCQLHNFSVSLDDIITSYPLERVREIHISGGSWDEYHNGDDTINIRRDTHDHGVPDEVFNLLKKVIPLCPNLTYVTLEQLGIALTTDDEKYQFQKDFLTMKNVVDEYNLSGKMHEPSNNFLPPKIILQSPPIDDEQLYQEQCVIAEILESAKDVTDAKVKFGKSIIANSAWEYETWPDYMLHTAIQITQKWK